MSKKVGMRVITSIFVFALVLVATLFNVNAENSPKGTMNAGALTSVKGLQLPINGGYYRSWHDKAHDPSRPNSMLDVPKEVNLVFVFPGGDEKPEFWRALKEDYVPAMNARGQKVVRTINLEMVLKGDKTGDVINYDLNESTYAKRAQQIYDIYVAQHGVNGLDIDYEKHHTLSADFKELLSDTDIDNATGIIKELKKILDKNNKLFILDTTMKATQLDRFNYERVNKLFPKISDCFDFVLMQAYGQKEADFNEFWETYKPYIKPEQYLIGFSWYEENAPKGNQWFDVPKQGESFLDSRAVKEHVKWQPSNGVKAGVFSYAIERDGVAHGDNNIVKSDFLNSVKVRELMESSGDYDLLTEQHIPDKHLLEEIKTKIGPYLRKFRLFDGDLEINNSEIESLQGLELMQNVKSLNLNGLSKVREINKDLLPHNIANVIPEAKNQKISNKLKLSGLASLEKLDLSGLNIETLEFSGVEKWTSLLEFNLSNNLLDFHEGSKNREILDTLIEKVKNNTAGDVSSLTLFGNQRPRSYFNPALLEKKVEVEKDSEANSVFKYLEIQETSAGRVIRNEDDFNALKKESVNGIEFLAKDLTFDQFKFDVSKFNAVITTHDNQMYSDTRNSGTPIINNKEEETYKVVYFDDNNKVVHELKYIVGAEKEIMLNLAENAKILGAPMRNDELREYGPHLFDNKLNDYGDGIFIYDAKKIEEKPFWIAFDLGEGAQVKKLEIWNATKANEYMLKDMNAKSGELLALKEANPDASKLSNREYLENDDNWEKIYSFTDSGHLKEIAKTFDQVHEHRIWKLKINGVVSNDLYRSLALSEIRLLGQRDNTVDKSALEALIKTAKTETEDVKWTDASKAELLAALENAEKIFSDESATKSQVSDIQEKLQKAIEALVEKTEADKEKLSYLVTMLDTLDLSDKTEQSIADLKAAETKAKELLAEKYASQEDVDQAEENLQKAINNLKVKSADDVNKVDKEGLQKAIKEAEEIDLSKAKEDENLNEFKNKLAEAKMLNELDGLTQEQIEKAISELNEARKALNFKDLGSDPEVKPGEDDSDDKKPGEEKPEDKKPDEKPDTSKPDKPESPEVQNPGSQGPKDKDSKPATSPLKINENSPFKEILILNDEAKHNGYTIWAEKLESSDKKEVFNIKLLDENGKAVQPRAKLRLEITIGFDLEKNEKLSLKHIKDNGMSENLETKVKGRQVEFETDGFSKFIFSAEKIASNNTTASTNNATKATSKAGMKTSPAKTGANAYYIPLAVVALGLASAITVVRKKSEN